MTEQTLTEKTAANETHNANPVAAPEHLQEAETLVHELHKLANNYEPLAGLDGIDADLQNLKELSETYRDGVAAAEELAREGCAKVADLRERTKLAADELQRLTDEGGPAPTQEQEAQIEVLARAARKLDKIAPVLERHFGDAAEDAAGKTAA